MVTMSDAIERAREHIIETRRALTVLVDGADALGMFNKMGQELESDLIAALDYIEVLEDLLEDYIRPSGGDYPHTEAKRKFEEAVRVT